MGKPSFFDLKILEQLNGEPAVSYPETDLNYPSTQRLYIRNLAETTLPYLDPEPDAVRFPNNVLSEQTILGEDRNRCKVLRKYERFPGPEIITYLQDSETQTPVRVTTQRVLKPSGPYAQVKGSEITYNPANTVHGTKTTTTLLNPDGSAPTYPGVTRTEYKEINFNFPSLVFAATALGIIESKAGESRARIAWTRRAAFQRQIKAKVDISYGALADLTIPAVYSPIYQDLIYDGVFFSYNERNVLNDAISALTYSTGTTIRTWGYKTETSPAIPASVPVSATQYLELVTGAAYTVISAVKTPWKYNLWRMEVTSIVME